MNSAANIAVVERFVATMNRGAFEEAYALIAVDAEYHNVPYAPVFGRQAVQDTIERAGVNECDWTIHYIAEANGVVLTERTDRVRVGERWIDIPLMGLFRIAGGEIVLWRDYFDPAATGPKTSTTQGEANATR